MKLWNLPSPWQGKPFLFTWKTDDGIFMVSSVSFLGNTINNWFTYIQSQGSSNEGIDIGIYGTVLNPPID